MPIDTHATPTYTGFKNSLLFFMVQDYKMTLQQLHEDGKQTVLYTFENAFRGNETLNNCAWVGRWIVTDNMDCVFAAQAIFRKNMQGIEIAEFHVDCAGNLLFDKIVPQVVSSDCYTGSLSLGSNGQLYYTERLLDAANSNAKIWISPHQSGSCSYDLPEPILRASSLPSFFLRGVILAWGQDASNKTYAALFSGNQCDEQKIPGSIERCFQFRENTYVYCGSKDGGTYFDRYVLV